MSIDVNDLQVILLPGKCAPKEHKDSYRKTYQCWREVWEATYSKEMHLDSRLFSDEFTRQDEVLALFHKGECAALVFFKWTDSEELATYQDSYFSMWPDTAFKQLCSRGPMVLVCSQFTVHAKYRKQEISFKDLLMALLVERFRNSDCDAMTGTMRLKKNMGEATYRTGATPLVRGLNYGKGDETVDLVAFFQDMVTDSVVPGIPEIVKKIFPKTIALARDVKPYNNVKEIKRAA